MGGDNVKFLLEATTARDEWMLTFYDDATNSISRVRIDKADFDKVTSIKVA
jgi:hypothetical protein